jgi:hypothetical protein
MKIHLTTFSFVFFSYASPGQDSAAFSKIQLSAYVEAYYCYDLSEPENHLRADFFPNYKRHNEVNLNLAYLKALYQTSAVRGNLAMMAGGYAQYNLAHEPTALQHIFEANAGAKLSKTKDLWLDAGIMPSHIGFETAVGSENWTLTRSLLAENTPYYETGARLSIQTENKKIYASALYLNGWQRTTRPYNNQSPAFGTQLTITPDSSFSFNWSTFAGNEFPKGNERWRIYNNFYLQYKPLHNWGIIAGADFGLFQNRHLSADFDSWSGLVCMVRYTPADKIAVAVRGEYFADFTNRIIPVGALAPAEMAGLSMNLDIRPVKKLIFRLEARTLYNGRAKIFMLQGRPSNVNYFFTTAFILAF